MGDNGDDGRGAGGGLGVGCDERHKQRRWWSGDRARLGACRQLWVPSLYLKRAGTGGISGGGGSLAGVGGFGAGAAELGIGGFGGGEGGSSGLYVGGGGCGAGPGGAVFVMQGRQPNLGWPADGRGQRPCHPAKAGRPPATGRPSARAPFCRAMAPWASHREPARPTPCPTSSPTRAATTAASLTAPTAVGVC
jgi:hypothetical protein